MPSSSPQSQTSLFKIAIIGEKTLQQQYVFSLTNVAQLRIQNLYYGAPGRKYSVYILS